jgi:hypothetical protein
MSASIWKKGDFCQLCNKKFRKLDNESLKSESAKISHRGHRGKKKMVGGQWSEWEEVSRKDAKGAKLRWQ